ncbi:hypothetical protein ACFQFC_18005 [Amorphoplanes digitatis]|uniref:Secreted protein n=1 Tax=Actinoplanes digitatis TaxID=1868 RepID=A0A7W7I468_9ACTN|nr:hypothetical protein [Actinoplanes digitatis]MBB4766110.1 hypothetical protein [Actinoplanes digitatis]BFE76108.1 hypothetical protein GCM10020092_094090 [Actinoplanes digitatis]GID98467.1 hypothetical protein Adi01nite_78790 [Actinoplanes digitatis]
MNGIRRIGVLAAAVLAATALTATPAAAGHHGPNPVVPWLEVVMAHQPTWIKVWWDTGTRICDAKVTVRAEHVGVTYPENTGSYTSFRRDSDLKPDRPDYTAFKVDADYNRNTMVPLEATLSYNTCGSAAVEKARTYWFLLPVLRDPDHHER